MAENKLRALEDYLQIPVKRRGIMRVSQMKSSKKKMHKKEA
jgi:hypothetical protein